MQSACLQTAETSESNESKKSKIEKKNSTQKHIKTKSKFRSSDFALWMREAAKIA